MPQPWLVGMAYRVLVVGGVCKGMRNVERGEGSCCLSGEVSMPNGRYDTPRIAKGQPKTTRVIERLQQPSNPPPQTFTKPKTTMDVLLFKTPTRS